MTKHTENKTIDKVIGKLGLVKIDHTDFDEDGYNRLCSQELIEIGDIIEPLLRESLERAYQEGIYACRIGEEKCPRHLSSLRCIDCIEELQIKPSQDE